MIQVFDFFSGCGGSSQGFADAGMEILFGLDNDRDASDTFRRNFPGASFIESDIKSVGTDALAELLASNRSDAVLFCGCAPCQPFSKQRSRSLAADTRSELLDEFARFVGAWRPDYVFVENVPGLQRVSAVDGPLGKFVSLLEVLGYEYCLRVVPAHRFGVPQTRERLLIVASIHGGIDLPQGANQKSTVRDWIGNLPSLRAGECDPYDSEHCAANLSQNNLARIAATPEGGGRMSWPQNLWLKCHAEHKGHTDVYGRLAWDKPAAGLTTRCISYSNGRFGHPDQNRAISIREAACLQTFPVDYLFSGSLSSKARQIGNAVPPLMARKIGEAIVAHHQETARSELGVDGGSVDGLVHRDSGF